ncbi:MAG: hypothetical protein LIQ31_09435 [Planctomycetes bacterium]|nr:hypothetical protein [Planctomycetota bacterium]
MRSKIGTKTRLAAHLLALVLLIFMLVYIPPQVAAEHRTRPAVRPVATERRPTRERDRVVEPPLRPAAAKTDQEMSHDPAATLDRVHVAPGRTTVPTEKLRPPVTADSGIVPSDAVTPPATTVPAAPVEPETTAVVPVPVPVAPPAAVVETVTPAEEAAPAPTTEAVTDAPASATDSLSAPVGEAVTDAGTTVPPTDAAVTVDVSASSSADAAVNDGTAAPVAAPTVPEPEEPPVSQPDESGALVVAETPPVRAAQLLPNASLEVLGDGVYWLDPRHDLEQELGAIPEVGGLVLLTPLPGYRSTGFEHLKTEVLPADPADLTVDAAEHFLDLTTNHTRPVVVAVLPGARGAAFFKGIYFLRNRNLPLDDVLRELEPELQEAGGARDAIVHRLIRFNAEAAQ